MQCTQCIAERLEIRTVILYTRNQDWTTEKLTLALATHEGRNVPRKRSDKDLSVPEQDTRELRTPVPVIFQGRCCNVCK